MESWDEVRTAYHVARLGTVSGAADVLGVHHATVIRHIDALETRIGVKLFQRHARGYTATEAGEDLLRVAQTTEDQFGQLVGRLKGKTHGVSGELVVTSLSGLSSMLVPTFASFQKDYPEIILRYLTGDRLFRLEYGEAHVAVRAGPSPDQPDNVVQPFVTMRLGLYASKDYAKRHGVPSSEADFKDHLFVGADNVNGRGPFNRWLQEHVDPERFVFRSTNDFSQRDAVLSGIGIGFLTTWHAKMHADLVEVIAPRDEWSAQLWLVTHVDLHRTTKVQTFLKHLKSEAKSWAS
jgi:DNA-binding transcriptional LysR family regulator